MAQRLLERRRDGPAGQFPGLVREPARLRGQPGDGRVLAGPHRGAHLRRRGVYPGHLLHCFHGRGNRLICSDGGLISEVRVARERGLFFDVGHGCGSFSWVTAQKAFEHEFYPDTLSTDLHRYSIAEPFQATLPEVMSKFLCLGMSLRDII